MKVVIVGAGGLGGLLGSVLHQAGHDVHLVARGDHLDALLENGLTVVTDGVPHTTHIAASDGSAGFDNCDVGFVTVKAHSLEGVAGLAVQLSQLGAWIVPLVNGVDAASRLISYGVEPSRVLAGVAYLTAFRTGPGVVERRGVHQRLLFGRPPQAMTRHPMLRLFEETPISVEIPEDIDRELWKKMAVVCALSGLCGSTNATIGEVRAKAGSAVRHQQAVQEVVDVARGRGVPLTDHDATRVHATLAAFDDSFFPSLVHDLRQGSPTEVDALCGAVVRIGAQVGVATPFYEEATAAIHRRTSSGAAG